MSGPIVYISHFKVKEGRLEELKRFTQTITAQIQAEKPGTVVFLQFLNEAGTEQSIVAVFPDEEAFQRHAQGAAERLKAAFEFTVLTGREIYGASSDEVIAILRPREGSGITFRHMPQPMSGYVRFRPARNAFWLSRAHSTMISCNTASISCGVYGVNQRKEARRKE